MDGFSFEADDGGVPPLGGQSNEADVIITIVIPEYFTEYFYWNDNDIENQTLTFVPDGSANFYLLCREEVSQFPTQPEGSLLSLGDNDSVRVYLADGKRVKIYGYSYSNFWVGSNGYITFGSSDSNPNESFANHFSKRRISGLFDDLDPSAGGAVRYKQYPDRIVVTYQDVPEKGTTNQNSFQIEMFFDGTIALTHLYIDAADGLCGLSEGAGIPDNFVDSDMSSFFVCSDFNRDYRVNLGDFAMIAEYWLHETCVNLLWCEGTDLDRSNQVDVFDVDHFAQYWLERISIAPPAEAWNDFRSLADEDGRVWDEGEGPSWRAGADSGDPTTSALRLGDYYTFNESYRTVLSFDTSFIPDDARVISATLELTRTSVNNLNPFDWAGDCLIDITSPYFGSDPNLTPEDWGAPAAAVAVASFPEDPGAFMPMVSTKFDIDGRMNINKFGKTQLRVYFTTPTNGDYTSDYISFYSGDWDLEENVRPKLTIRYITRMPAFRFDSIANEDGRVWDDGGGFGVGNDYKGDNHEALRLGDYSGGQSYRTILSFDTIIDSIELEYYEIDTVEVEMTRGRLRGQDPFVWGGNCVVDVASPYFGTGTQLENGDFEAVPDANNVAYFLADPGEFNTMTSTLFNAEGIENINLDGRTQIRVYFTVPTNGDAVIDSMGFYSGEYEPFESYRPTLVIRFKPD
ncbi:MAG TPA: hypothetical protein HPP51_01920 [Planctomycetes bacterium]|nr:hypothetical protein [Planctomycetota bacterium]